MQPIDRDLYIQWKRHPYLGLYVPGGAVSSHPSEADLAFATYVTYEELFDRKYDLTTLEEELSRHSVTDLVSSLAKIGMAVHNDGLFNKKAQKILVRKILPTEIAKDVESSLTAERNKFAFFGQQILALLKYSFVFGSPRPASNFEEGRTFPQFTTTLLGVTDLLDQHYSLEEAEAGSRDDAVRAMKGMVIRNLYLNSTQQLRSLIPRYHRLFFEIPRMESLRHSPDYVDLADSFREATGLDFRTFYSIGFGILAQFLRISALHLESLAHFFIRSDTYFRLTSVPPSEVKLALAEFSKDVDHFRSKFCEQLGARPDLFPWDFMEFRRYPLLRLEDRVFVPLSLRFLQERISAGIYWILFDHFQAQGEDKRLQFTRFFGEIFEHYVCEIFERIFPPSTRLANRLFFEPIYYVGRQQFKAADIMLFNGNAAIFVEVTSSRMKTMRTAIPGDVSEFERDLEKIIYSAARQLDRVIIDFRQRRLVLPENAPDMIRKIYPVILTIEGIPQVTLIRQDIDDELSRRGLLQKPGIARLALMDCEELEILEPLLQQGLSLLDILQEWEASPHRNLPLKNFLLQNNRVTHANERLREEFRKLTKDAGQLLFSHGLPEKAEPV